MNRLNGIRLNSNLVDWNFVPENQKPADSCTWYNRLNNIRLNSNVLDWNFIQVDQNPADLRYMPFTILKDNKTGFYGPEQSNEFIISDESKVNIDDRGLK